VWEQQWGMEDNRRCLHYLDFLIVETTPLHHLLVAEGSFPE